MARRPKKNLVACRKNDGHSNGRNGMKPEEEFFVLVAKQLLLGSEATNQLNTAQKEVAKKE